jgi:hypothetical protein
MMTFSNIACLNQPTRTPRQLIGIDIELSGNSYNWIVYTPLISGEPLIQYIESISNILKNDIEYKEQIWSVSPHTQEIMNPFTNETTIADIPKESVVCPTIPDYVEAITNTGYSAEELNSILFNLGENYWHYPLYIKRIVAPIDLIMDDVGIKMYGWFQLNQLPIIKFNSVVQLYCNEILPQHQAIVDQLQDIITVQNKP